MRKYKIGDVILSKQNDIYEIKQVQSDRFGKEIFWVEIFYPNFKSSERLTWVYNSDFKKYLGTKEEIMDKYPEYFIWKERNDIFYYLFINRGSIIFCFTVSWVQVNIKK